MSWASKTASPVSRLQIARYACAVGDFNPVHVDEDFAKASGMPSVIAHGPLTASIVLDLVVGQIGVDSLRSFEVRLSAPVFPGDVLTVEPAEGGATVLKADGSVAAKVLIEVAGA